MAKQQTLYKMTKLSEIRPYERNPRIIPQAAVDAVAKSIAAFGFRQPIVVDGDGVILAGHTRYKAAQQLGLEAVPVVWQTDITEIQARGYRIADNKTAEIAAWDRDALDAEVRELAGMDDDAIASLGMSDWELDRILNECTEGCHLEEIHADGHTPGFGKPYQPYENGDRSGGVVNPGRYGVPQPDARGVGADIRCAVKIVFPDRTSLEAAKELLDRAAADNLGVITVCDP